MDTGLLSASKFEGLKEDFNGTLSRLKSQIVEAQDLGDGDRKKELLYDIENHLSDADGMLSEMSKEVDLSSGRAKADFKNDMNKCKTAKQTIKENFDRVNLHSGGSGGGGGCGASDAEVRHRRSVPVRRWAPVFSASSLNVPTFLMYCICGLCYSTWKSCK